jgi:c-di-GMP-binding flagellar brake protein YcgR
MDIDKPFDIMAKVIYSKKIENRPGYFENRVKFEYITKTTREEIIKYIFDEERKNRKNSKGS